jgi:hypothetical protein
MIRFDTFRFDYDTKNVIVFSRAAVVLLVRHALLLTMIRKMSLFSVVRLSCCWFVTPCY